MGVPLLRLWPVRRYPMPWPAALSRLTAIACPIATLSAATGAAAAVAAAAVAAAALSHADAAAADPTTTRATATTPTASVASTTSAGRTASCGRRRWGGAAGSTGGATVAATSCPAASSATATTPATPVATTAAAAAAISDARDAATEPKPTAPSTPTACASAAATATSAANAVGVGVLIVHDVRARLSRCGAGSRLVRCRLPIAVRGVHEQQDGGCAAVRIGHGVTRLHTTRTDVLGCAGLQVSRGGGVQGGQIRAVPALRAGQPSTIGATPAFSPPHVAAPAPCASSLARTVVAATSTASTNTTRA